MGKMLFLFIGGTAVVIGVLSIVFGLARFISGYDGLRRRPQFTLQQLLVSVVLLAVTFFILMTSHPERIFSLFLMAVALLVLSWAARIWIDEFVCLMGLHDEDFPGRHDKLIWAIALLFFAPMGIWAFRSYRSVRWPAPKKSIRPGFHDVEFAESM